MVEVKEIAPTNAELKKYIRFGISLYKDNDCYVPPMIFDDLHTLSPQKNPAFEYCHAQNFMAYKDGKPAGVITAIVNDRVNEKSGKKQARFGFVEFVDDVEVVDALFHAAEQWARNQGMTEIVGPMGFTDMDHEGMLIEGFDQLGTMATIYNYPYYPQHMERMGYVKDADWVEFRVKVPEDIPPKMKRVAQIVMQKYGLKIKKYTSGKKAKADYGQALFECINQTYSDLYGYCQLSKKQIDYYVDMYLKILPLDYLSIVTDKDDNLVGVGITIPSLSKALQKCRGRLFPLGWFHILKALHSHNDIVDLMLIAVKPEYQNKGVNSLLFYDLLPIYIRNKHVWAESNLELETNANVQSQWAYFDHHQHRRRRAYRKSLTE